MLKSTNAIPYRALEEGFKFKFGEIKMWHNDSWLDKNVLKADEFDYSVIDRLDKFKSTHPKTMLDRVHKQSWKFDFDLSMIKQVYNSDTSQYLFPLSFQAHLKFYAWV